MTYQQRKKKKPEEPSAELIALRKEIEELRKKIEKLSVAPIPPPAPKGTGLFGGRRTPVPIIDTATKRVYHAKATCGKLLAPEADTTADDNFAWYKLIAKFPNRFREATPEEIEAAKKAGLYKQEVV